MRRLQVRSEDAGRQEVTSPITPGPQLTLRARLWLSGVTVSGDSFEDTALESVLAGLGVGRLIVADAQTDACIRSTPTAPSLAVTMPRWLATPTPQKTTPNTALCAA